MDGRKYAFGLVVGIFFAACGCTSQDLPENILASAQKAYDDALVAIESGDYAAARPLLDTAIAAGGLPVDLAVDAYLKRSMCLADGGDFQGAQADIETAAQGASDLEYVHVARGFLLAKQGDQAGAEREYQQARSLNPKVILPK